MQEHKSVFRIPDRWSQTWREKWELWNTGKYLGPALDDRQTVWQKTGEEQGWMQLQEHPRALQGPRHLLGRKDVYHREDWSGTSWQGKALWPPGHPRAGLSSWPLVSKPHRQETNRVIFIQRAGKAVTTSAMNKITILIWMRVTSASEAAPLGVETCESLWVHKVENKARAKSFGNNYDQTPYICSFSSWQKLYITYLYNVLITMTLVNTFVNFKCW